MRTSVCACVLFFISELISLLVIRLPNQHVHKERSEFNCIDLYSDKYALCFEFLVPLDTACFPFFFYDDQQSLSLRRFIPVR